MTGKKLATFVLVLVLLFSFSALGAPKNLIVSQMYDAVSLDPHGRNANDQASIRVRSQIYDTLVKQDNELNIIPGLAIAWRQVSELIWEFDLRPNVKFHNGDILSAEDVKFSLDRLRDPATGSPGAFIVDFIDKVEVVDSLKVRIITKTPFAPMLAHLSHDVTGILNRNVLRQVGANYGTRVVIGTGPFKFVSWSAGSHIILDRNPDYWGEVAKVDRVTFRAIPEGTVRAIELETNGVDIALDIEATDQMFLAMHRGIKLIETPGLGADYVGFNCQRPPFDNVLVRQAINHAIDMDLIIDVVFEGQGVRAVSPISPTVWGAHPGLQGYEYNPALAMELLAEAGYPNGFKTTLWTNDSPPRMMAAEIMQADLAAVGIEVDVQIIEWGKYLEDTAEGRHDMFILGWTTITADADYGLYALFHSEEYGDPGNRTFWSTPRLDELLELGRTTVDLEDRLAIYYEAQEIIEANAPWIFMRSPINVDGVRFNIEGFKPHPSGNFFLNTVDKI